MDQNKFKRLVVEVIILISTTSYAAAETTNEPPSTVSPPPQNKPKINLKMVILLACLITAFLLMCFFFIYFLRYAERQLALAATTGSDQRTAMNLGAARGLDPAVIAEFTSFKYSTVKDIKIGQHVLECAVCLNEFHDHEALRLLPECRHVFHRDCIDEWLDSHVTCPVCRASLVPKPSQLSRETELTGGVNKRTKDHVSVELVDLKHDLAPPRKLSRSCSMGHPIGNVDRYTLRLPDDVQNVLRNNGTQTKTGANVSLLLENGLKTSGANVSLLLENGLKTSLKSASASYVRGSNYFDYERFGHERQPSGRNFGITGSFISRSGSGSGFGSDVKDSTTTSKRLLTSVKSLNRLLQIPNKDTDHMIMTRLNDS